MLGFLTFAFLNFLAMISPGPDFAIVSRYGLAGQRKAALQATFGVCAALIIHVLYCLLGVAFFIQSNPILLKSIQVFGGCYLFYLGYQLIKNRAKRGEMEEKRGKAFFVGFFTNLLNPKCTVFLLSLFIQFVDPSMSIATKISYGMSIPLLALGWFSFLAFFLTKESFLPKLEKYQKLFSVLMGTLLIVLASSIFFSALK